MTLQYWYMLPIAVLIATIATASGVGGATLFAPLFILALGIPPELAVGAVLVTEVFGFASGLYAYYRRRLIDYRLAGISDPGRLEELDRAFTFPHKPLTVTSF